MKKKFSRKLLIERSFQLRGAWLITLSCLGLAGFLIFAMSMFVRHYYNQLDRDGAFLNPATAEVFREGWFNLLGILVGVSFLYGAATFVISLFLTRNIVGPVVGFSSRVRELLASGKTIDFKLRKGDQLQSLVNLYKDIAIYVDTRGTQGSSPNQNPANKKTA